MKRLPPDRQQALVEMVRELGPRFAERAHKYDRDASFPYENYEDLREIGFLGLAIPERYGGLGADLATYALVSEEIGRYCGSTALTFNMHTATCLFTGPIADDLDWSEEQQKELEERREPLYRGILSQGHIHSQPFSEGVKTGALEGYSTTAVPTDGGYRVTGVKIFASLSDAADFHNVLAMVPDDDQVHFLGVPADAEGVTIEGEWDPLGMRGTVSKNLVMEDVFVPSENEWLPAGGFNQAATRWPFMYLTLSFAFLGLMRGAIDFTRDYLVGRGGPGERREIPQKQQGWAEMLLKHEEAQSLTYRVLTEMHIDPEPELVKRAWAAVVSTMETAPEVASLAIRVCGGRALLKPLALERIYRDSRCGATMLPWSVDVALDRLGHYELFEETGAPA